MSVDTMIMCAKCGKPPSFDCRAHFVAEREAILAQLDIAKALLARAHTMLEGRTAYLGKEIATFLWNHPPEAECMSAAESKEK